jgi:hypothetical protein
MEERVGVRRIYCISFRQLLLWVRADGNGTVERLTTENLNPLLYSIFLDTNGCSFGGDDMGTGLDLYIAVIEPTAGGLILGHRLPYQASYKVRRKSSPTVGSANACQMPSSNVPL